MKYIKGVAAATILTAVFACGSKQNENHDHHSPEPSAVAVDTIKKSIPKETHAQVGPAHITIKYHAPAVRGRMIWGGLVPYGDVWVTGAHNATSFEINKNFRLGGMEIPAGKYAIFTIPAKDEWTLIINRNWEQHLADEYDAKDDVIRVPVVPQEAASIQERLAYTITSNNDSGATLNISWEKVRLSIPFEVSE